MERNNPTTNRDGGLLMRSESRSPVTTSSDLFLQWGNRKRLRCMKVQAKDHSNNDSAGSAPVNRTTARVDRRVIRSDLNNNTNKDSTSNHQNNNHATAVTTKSNGYLNLRQRPASPSHRILRNSDSSIGMRGQSNGVRGVASPDRGGDKKGTANNNSNNHHHHHNNNKNNDNNHHGGSGGGGSTSSETAHDGKKGGSSGSDTIPSVWPPKFVIALTNKEKEEDFMAIKGSKLPQRPKKRAKFIQRTLNLVSPGAWLCDLTLERYEVREKKVSKKRPRGLKAMGNMESDSE
ncbi:homeobox protein 2 [Forsythia ovata]|uniref:Homeobox protein 2 n=1 Tax=Forsythia ovata TaxID=205694 RepID=A0ABD1W5L8_9LAMI